MAFIFFVLGFYIRHYVQLVDAGVSRKVNQHHYPQQFLHRCDGGVLIQFSNPMNSVAVKSTGNDDEVVSLSEF